MLAGAGVIGFAPVRDLAAAEAFYCGKLGLKKQEVNEFALVLEGAGGTMIRCVLAPDFTPQPFTILGWEVVGMAAAVAELKGAGVTPLIFPHFNLDKDGVWTAPNGDKVAWFKDPDGNVLSLSEHQSVKTK